MFEYGVTKIMDGIYISDDNFANDEDFLISNKISHVIKWSSVDHQPNATEQLVKILYFDKFKLNGQLPSCSQLSRIFAFIEQSQQQYLCCLISSDLQSEAAMLLSLYLIQKFHWTLGTTFQFIQLKFNCFNPRVQIVQLLQDFQLHLQTMHSNIKFQSIQFTYQFLIAYQTQDFNEKFLINTIKNMLAENIKYEKPIRIAQKKGKRVRWSDRIRPFSSVKQLNSKFIIYNRNLSLKPKKLNNQKQNNLQRDKTVKRNIKSDILNKNVNINYSDQFIFDQFEIQSLKELTLNKKHQTYLKNKLKKVNSLKILTSNNKQKQKQNNHKNIFKQKIGITQNLLAKTHSINQFQKAFSIKNKSIFNIKTLNA